MTLKIKNKNVKSCLLCQNAEVNAIVDPMLFKLDMSLAACVENLEQRNICVDLDQLREHSHHIFVESDNGKDMELEKIKSSSNLEMVKDTLATISAIERQYIAEGSELSPEMNKLWVTKQRFLEIKSKLEGDLVEKVEINIPEWIRLIPATNVEYKMIEE